MNRKLLTISLIGSVVFGSTLALGNPSMLPNHPGYPMGDAKSPVTGQSVANDSGQSPPSQVESLHQAGEFHDAYVINPAKEERANESGGSGGGSTSPTTGSGGSGGGSTSQSTTGSGGSGGGSTSTGSGEVGAEP